MAGADLYRLRKEHRLAAFMLHQAAEQLLHGLLFLGTGLRMPTHSIDKLVRYCSLFSYRLPDLFPKEAESDKKLLRLLNHAYIHARYKEDYHITGEELQALSEKIKTLASILETSYSLA